MRKLFCLILGLLSALFAAAQYNMPTTGTVTHASDDCWVYDDGGPSGNYGNYVSGVMLVNTASTNKYFIINLTYDLEVTSHSSLKIYNANNGAMLFSNSNTNTSGTISINPCTDKIRIVFTTDSDNPHSGFAMHLTTCVQPPPMVSLFGDNLFGSSYQSPHNCYVTWDLLPGYSDYVVAFGPCPFDINNATVITVHDIDSLSLTGLDTCDTICVSVVPVEYLNADVCSSCVIPPVVQIILNPCRLHPQFISVSPYTEDSISNPVPLDELEDSILVAWAPVDSVEFYILQYWTLSNPMDTITDTIYNTDTILTNLVHCEIYKFIVKTPCDHLSCDDRIPPNTTWIHCLCPQPMNTTITRVGGDSLLIKWTEPYDTIQWTVALFAYDINTGQETVDYYYTDTTFLLLSGTCGIFYTAYVYSNCHNLPFEEICKMGKDTLHSISCCALPLAAVVNNNIRIGTNSITIPWSNANDSLTWVIVVYQDTNLVATDTTTAGTITLNNLAPETQYTIYIYCYSPSLDSCNVRMLSIFTFGNCITYYNLNSPNVKTTIGYYDSPYAFTRLVDNGPLNISSRHTVNTDVSAADPRTGNLLKTIPDGSEQSVRLGNWNNGAEAESITYTYFVDTNIFDLILLNYAIVMQDSPDHNDVTIQPHFILEIIDSNGHLIDPVCGTTDFVAGGNTNTWNHAADNVIWKDWTSAGFNLAPYHNQKINVRITTKDCSAGGHYGYAYYTLECRTKQMISVACGGTSANTFLAPEGFAYQWYNENNPNVILSTDREFSVSDTGTQHYYCVVISLENPNCSFRINATAGNRFPIADFDYSYTFENCEFTVTFTNTSYVASDPEGTLPTSDRCETAQWRFDNGDTASTNTTSHVYASSGDYHVILVAGLANNSCTDTLDMIIHLESPVGLLTIQGDSSICVGETTTLTATMNGQYLWSTGDTTQSITITPDTTILISLQVLDELGCMNTTERLVEVNPHYRNIDVYDTICDNVYYAPQGEPLTNSGVYYLELQTIAGCDSIIYLHLTVNPTFFDTIYDSICQYDSYEFYGQEYDSAGTYYAIFTNIYGCDSVYVLNLFVKPIYTDTIKADVFKGKTFSLFGFSESEKGIYTHTFEGSNGCDSIIVLDLTVDNVMFPNVITANDDGVNDVFVIHNLLEQNIFPENELVIFNRYGKLMYHKKNISQESDFWKPDASTPTGTYFYRFTGVRHDKTWDTTGTIDVIR
ncbi:MAG: gliding motility-associated C-terminal domain-containing protein [Bacteroidales bacterium]|jgi:gliding motility-associated-like protein|nr:gliding motility-associated C-terminal domain-containing protein [Bacteroidales bacterium]